MQLGFCGCATIASLMSDLITNWFFFSDGVFRGVPQQAPGRQVSIQDVPSKHLRRRWHLSRYSAVQVKVLTYSAT